VDTDMETRMDTVDTDTMAMATGDSILGAA
jgi:hypothetical protein